MNEYYNAKIARDLNCSEEKHQFLHLVFRQFWHTVYDHAPSLLNCFEDNGKDFLEHFLIFLGDQREINPFLHLALIDYLKKEKKEIFSKKIEEELLISSCILWVRTNISKNTCFVLFSKTLNTFFVASKSKRIGEAPSIDQFENTDFKIDRDLLLVENENHFEDIVNYDELVSSMRHYTDEKRSI